MKRHVMKVVVAVICLAVPLVGAEEQATEPVNPEVTKLIAKLTAEIDQLAPILPDGVSEEDKGKFTEEFSLLKNYIKTTLMPLCTNKVFAQEIARQNAQSISLEEIQKIDKQWAEAEDELPIQAEKMGNACAQEIKRVAKAVPVLGETFVMDNQGANVGQNALTSDYWQGDEPKWKNSYKDGKGGIDVGKRQLDKSTNVVDQKVSLPIVNEEGKVIGAVCLGVKVEMLKQVAVASDN